VARALLVMGKLPLVPARQIDHTMWHPESVTPEVTREYGHYLVHIAGCAGCHGGNLAGGPIAGAPPDAPPAQNLTPTGLGAWSMADFARAMRTGERPDGTTINPYMPWITFRNMTDDELHAIWLYLKHVPPSSASSR
jgi:mono/diheme cytochrome c family protein